ncbi:hypothetical protein RFI_35245 [Reticulomyxa filosa]|uniref:Kinesin light chain n=1 Tax=Reticulomyxa filosa TaxID=46433 RepID=X6LLE2_RETFI|nr:hypothetical protein RFI_35245 [Reticulomyxa filosa]|eukprot:ETO02191.1 hypothetical protein RFI_35245 [Reticulomyxa filosa]
MIYNLIGNPKNELYYQSMQNIAHLNYHSDYLLQMANIQHNLSDPYFIFKIQSLCPLNKVNCLVVSISHIQKCIFPIKWNTKINHDIPIKLFNLNNKANYYLSKKKFIKAIVYLQKVIQIVNDTFDIEHPYVAALNDSLGVIYLKIGQYDKSIEYCEIALKVRLTIFGTYHIDIAISFHNLGLLIL